MGCFSGIAKFCLVVSNIIFLLLGLVFVILGFILRFGKVLYEPFLQTGIDQIKKVVTDTPLASFDTSDLDLGSVVQSLAIGLIVGGLFLCAISFVGCCGACYKIDCLLWLYIIAVTVFFVAEAITIGILYGKPSIDYQGMQSRDSCVQREQAPALRYSYRKHKRAAEKLGLFRFYDFMICRWPTSTFAKDELKTVSLPQFKGLDSSEPVTLGWNVVMIQFKCCGVDSYKDFDVSKNWSRTSSGNIKIDPPLVTPIACCKQLPNKVNHAVDCAQGPFKEDLNNGNTGCYDTIWDQSFGNEAIAIPVLLICGGIQLGFIVFALMILRSEKESVGPI